MVEASRSPFFIFGSPRSGTTILRDILRQHDRLAAPEETSFYRWPYAFKSQFYTETYRRNASLKRHRAIDGVSDEEFANIYEAAQTRRQFQDAYMDLFLAKAGKPNGRWFDKTPQNVYGLLMFQADYPDARYIHIHRNPLNVVASLIKGDVMPKQHLQGAINWWTEAIGIVQQFRPHTTSMLDVKYETFLERPAEVLAEILRFVGEDPAKLRADLGVLRKERNSYLKILGAADIELVLEYCGPLMQALGYETDPAHYLPR